MKGSLKQAGEKVKDAFRAGDPAAGTDRSSLPFVHEPAEGAESTQWPMRPWNSFRAPATSTVLKRRRCRRSRGCCWGVSVEAGDLSGVV